MVDMFLMNYLLQCIYQGTKLILVGDSDQLASVGPGSVLSDLVKSETIETVHLDKIFRQAAKSKIILNAHRVNEGKQFLKKEDKETENTDQDFFYINKYNADDITKEVISLCTGRLQNYGDYDFMQNIQVLTPTKRGQLGTKELNKILQEFVNPSAITKKEKISGSIIYRVGDRVMQIKNNYDIYWEKRNVKTDFGTDRGSGVFNGELGIIKKIDNESKNIEVEFDDGKIAWYAFNELDQLEHSYAITIHKAQRKRI
jgi:exodeoxyribonuclease V alpha subunit